MRGRATDGPDCYLLGLNGDYAEETDSKRRDDLGSTMRDLKKKNNIAVRRSLVGVFTRRDRQDNVNTVKNVRFEIPDCNPGNRQVIALVREAHVPNEIMRRGIITQF